MTALHWAVLCGHIETVQVLLGAGSAVNAVHAGGDTLLHCAARRCQAEVVQLLLGTGSAVNARTARGDTALHCACAAYRGHAEVAEVVRLLLVAGSAVDAANENGETALHCAARQGYAKAVRLLLNAGADPQPSLAAAVQRGHHGIAQLLRDAGAAD
jgi:cytohesin